MASSMIFTMDNPLLKCLMVHAALLVFKMAFVTMVTIYYRLTRKAFLNDEDVKFTDTSGKVKVTANPDVDRARRSYMNDMENIFIFFPLALMYIATDPAITTCQMCFRVFTICRYGHTIAYLLKIKQPFRGITFTISFIVLLFMAYEIFSETFSYF